MTKREHVWRRGQGEDIRIGVRRGELPPAPTEEPHSVPAPSPSRARTATPGAKFPPILKDPGLRVDRSNQPKEGEQFGSEFLDNLAHQMVAPLQSIEMHCANIVDGLVESEDVAKRLKEVAGHARILVELARRMRFLHELVSGKVIDTEKLEFEKIVTTWIDGFNNYLPITRTNGMDVDIQHQVMNRLPRVLASRLAAHQVIMNLYDNAMKYGQSMSVLRVQGRREGPYVINDFSHAARVVLTRQACEHIFERGFRSEEAKAVRASGTGVGMWVSRELMRAMQGELEAFPTTDDGVTKFRLWWRIA